MSTKSRTYSFKQKVLYTTFIIAFFTSIIILFGEVLIRLIEKPQAYSNRTEIDSQLGWIPKSDLELNYSIEDAAGKQRKVEYKTHNHGFRTFGKLKTDKKKILFIGDSYTQAVEVSNPNTYFNVIGDSLDVEVFAFGQAGYGTVQQALIIDRYFDEIQPDLVILQTCDNDFIDNQVELEYNSNYQVGLRRPYLDSNDQIFYANPKSYQLGLIRYSKFLSLLKKKFKYGVLNKVNDSSEKLIAEKKDKYLYYKASKESTSLALKRIKNTISETSLIMFSASVFEPQLSDFKHIAEELNIPFFSHPAKMIENNKYDQTLTSHDKYHWVSEGHQMIANELIPIVKKQLEAQ